MTAVLFVCLGNICRSPAGAAILDHLVTERGLQNTIQVDSCGMGDWHVGHSPDNRMQKSAQLRGFVLSGRAKVFQREFFDRFDYILAVDHEVLKALHDLAETTEQRAKIHLVTAFSTSFPNKEVPDPFYGHDGAFEHVLDILEDSCEGLLETLLRK